MVGKTRLYQRTGSPLIHGAMGRRRSPWPWIIAVLVVAVAAVVAYYLIVR